MRLFARASRRLTSLERETLELLIGQALAHTGGPWGEHDPALAAAGKLGLDREEVKRWAEHFAVTN